MGGGGSGGEEGKETGSEVWPDKVRVGWKKKVEEEDEEEKEGVMKVKERRRRKTLKTIDNLHRPSPSTSSFHLLSATLPPQLPLHNSLLSASALFYLIFEFCLFMFCKTVFLSAVLLLYFSEVANQ